MSFFRCVSIECFKLNLIWFELLWVDFRSPQWVKHWAFVKGVIRAQVLPNTNNDRYTASSGEKHARPRRRWWSRDLASRVLWVFLLASICRFPQTLWIKHRDRVRPPTKLRLDMKLNTRMHRNYQGGKLIISYCIVFVWNSEYFFLFTSGGEQELPTSIHLSYGVFTD